MQQVSTVEQSGQDPGVTRVPQERYAYYRRCQVFRKGDEQCRAPAEKDSHICYPHAGQQAMTLRRKLQSMVLLAEVARRMRARGKPEFEVADIFMDFNAIQVTLAVMAQGLIDGRIDCKTAGRLLVELQTFSKLLWMVHRTKTSTTEARRHGEKPRLPQISADERRLSNGKDSTTKEHKGATEVRPTVVAETAAKIVVMRNTERTYMNAERAHGPPGWARAA
jgi:hypothetical protein